MSHSSSDPFALVSVDGQENACVDFRYCADANMNWWFDHHVSGFQPASLRTHFEADTKGTKFFDPKARSCALFMARQLRDEFGYEPHDPEGHWQQLLTWADRIDGAVFESAEEIVALDSPALRIMTWLRGCQDSAAIVRMIPLLGSTSLAEIESLPWVAVSLRELLSAHQNSIQVIEQNLVFKDAVVSYDLSDTEVNSHSAFIAYMLCPQARHSISLARNGALANISVGRNPWATQPGEQNIASLCEAYGGGGHPHVGGISVPAGTMQRPREIVEELRRALADTESQ